MNEGDQASVRCRNVEGVHSTPLRRISRAHVVALRRILVTSDGSRYAPGWLVKEARRGRASAGGSDVAGDGGAEKGDASGGSSAASSAHAGGLSLAACVVALGQRRLSRAREQRCAAPRRARS